MGIKKTPPGGKRENAGRKPGPALKLRKWLVESRTEEATFAFDFYCSVMHDDNMPIDLRMTAAKEVMDRVLGKPKQSIELSGDEHKPITINPIDYRAVLAPLAPIPVRNGDSSGEGEDNQPGETSG